MIWQKLIPMTRTRLGRWNNTRGKMHHRPFATNFMTLTRAAGVYRQKVDAKDIKMHTDWMNFSMCDNWRFISKCVQWDVLRFLDSSLNKYEVTHSHQERKLLTGYRKTRYLPRAKRPPTLLIYLAWISRLGENTAQFSTLVLHGFEHQFRILLHPISGCRNSIPVRKVSIV